MKEQTIIYTEVDEAPALATYSSTAHPPGLYKGLRHRL